MPRALPSEPRPRRHRVAPIDDSSSHEGEVMSDFDGILDVSTSGNVTDQSKAYATEKVTRLISRIRDPVLQAQIRLTAEPNPARDRPAIAEATLDVNGSPVRAQVAGGDMDEAVDLLEERLRRRIARHEQRLHHEGRARHWTGQADRSEWRHGDLPTQRPEWYDRPPEERELVRQKTFALEAMTVDEAAFDLDMLDHDFYLFTEITTGADSLLSYDRDHGLELRQPEGTRGDPLDGTAASVRQELPAPTLSTAEALERLDAGGEKFVFFVDSDSRRGTVAYHRYDGHYGLISAG